MQIATTDHPAIGRHFLVDISHADKELLNDETYLMHMLLSAAECEGVTVLNAAKHKFTPQGVTILIMLSESHISLHTYPEEGKAFFDAFTCGTRYEPARIFDYFVKKLPPSKHRILSIYRG